MTIRDYSFSPSRVAVMPGESVTWQADGTCVRRTTSTSTGEVAPLGAPSTNFNDSRPFPDAGTYRYRCDVHATMNGTVFVNATGTVPTPSPPTAVADGVPHGLAVPDGDPGAERRGERRSRARPAGLASRSSPRSGRAPRAAASARAAAGAARSPACSC